MPCQECQDQILNPTPPNLCTSCPESCAEQMDLDCVIYKPTSTVPSNLRNLGLGNNVSATEIIEQIDFLIGQNFNIDLTIINTESITLTVSGPAKHTLRADVVISPDADNKLELRANGLYVA